MNVLAEILTWSNDRPAWQRDALRRLLAVEELDDSDIEELAGLCKAPHGLAENPQEPQVLAAKHLPKTEENEALADVRLDSITHHTGVNALAPEQTIEFGPQLTVIYGQNAAGKSGYTRVLKQACRARGAEDILGNVVEAGAPARPSATIRFRTTGNTEALAWQGGGESHDALRNVSVFDAHCAAVYLKQKTDVAFRPFGLDLFDKLSDACESVKRLLDKARDELTRQSIPLPNVTEGTVAHQKLGGLTSLTNVEELRAFATLSDEEQTRLSSLPREIADLDSTEPEKRAASLNLCAERLERTLAHIESLGETLDSRELTKLFEQRDAASAAQTKAQELRNTSLPAGLLTGTGSDHWRTLWEAARRFSNASAYPDHPFPVDEDAHCVLCQQELRDEAVRRLQQFEAFVQSEAEATAKRLRATYDRAKREFEDQSVLDDATQALLQELSVESEELATSLEASFAAAATLRDSVLKALTSDAKPPALTPLVAPQSGTAMVATLRKRASDLVDPNRKRKRGELIREHAELTARQTLLSGFTQVVSEIERKKKLAAYALCRKDTQTNAITTKSTQVTKATVTDTLAASFQSELTRLKFRHVEVELRPVGGGRGALYHKLVLKRAPNQDLPQVVSEGEARCLSIAAFFAELATTEDPGAILFDDPVSSLDHHWREAVAKRLVDESKRRQVVVCTHDIVFLLALTKFAEKAEVDCQHRHLRQEHLRPGFVSPELPWDAMPLKKRIRWLKNEFQRVEKVFRTEDREVYDKEALFLYGRLRQSWERGVEEVLLAGTVLRYRSSIETKRATDLMDITDVDCKELEDGMTKTSRWSAHDLAPAEAAEVPDADELQGDIAALESWVNRITSRRQ